LEGSLSSSPGHPQPSSADYLEFEVHQSGILSHWLLVQGVVVVGVLLFLFDHLCSIPQATRTRTLPPPPPPARGGKVLVGSPGASLKRRTKKADNNQCAGPAGKSYEDDHPPCHTRAPPQAQEAQASPVSAALAAAGAACPSPAQANAAKVKAGRV